MSFFSGILHENDIQSVISCGRNNRFGNLYSYTDDSL